MRASAAEDGREDDTRLGIGVQGQFMRSQVVAGLTRKIEHDGFQSDHLIQNVTQHMLGTIGMATSTRTFSVGVKSCWQRVRRRTPRIRCNAVIVRMSMDVLCACRLSALIHALFSCRRGLVGCVHSVVRSKKKYAGREMDKS